VSVKVVRIKVASHLAALNQPAISLEILKRQHALAKELVEAICHAKKQVDGIDQASHHGL
jgi:hypothetical protein